jgi:hypothetical protein
MRFAEPDVSGILRLQTQLAADPAAEFGIGCSLV